MFVQVVQDIVCPWCRIGKHNLDDALARWQAAGNEPVDVQWFPYLLDPIEPGAGERFRERFTERKGMPPEQVDGMFARVSEVGKQAGLEFRFDRIEYAQNTLKAHELVALTPVNRQAAVLDGLHRAYFVEGRNLEDVAVLVDIARAAGIEGDALRQLQADLESGTRRQDVMAMIGQAQAAGVSGVPFFIIDGKLALSGAQPAEVIFEAMEKAAAQPATVASE